MDGDDVGVRELGDRLGLAQQPAAAALVAGLPLRVQELERDLAIELRDRRRRTPRPCRRARRARGRCSGRSAVPRDTERGARGCGLGGRPRAVRCRAIGAAASASDRRSRQLAQPATCASSLADRRRARGAPRRTRRSCLRRRQLHQVRHAIMPDDAAARVVDRPQTRRGTACRRISAAPGRRGRSDRAREACRPAALRRHAGALCARGRAAHPERRVEDVVFAAHLGRCGAPVDRRRRRRRARRGSRTSAAPVCAGTRSRSRQLRALHRPVLAGYLRHVDRSPAFVDEVEQRLWDGALVGIGRRAAEARSLLRQGTARGLARRRGPAHRAHDAAARGGGGAGRGRRRRRGASSWSRDPELAFIKVAPARSIPARASAEALGALDDRERMIYRLHIVDGLTVGSHRRRPTASATRPCRGGWRARATASSPRPSVCCARRCSIAPDGVRVDGRACSSASSISASRASSASRRSHNGIPAGQHPRQESAGPRRKARMKRAGRRIPGAKGEVPPPPRRKG